MSNKRAFIVTGFYNYDYPIRIKYLEKYLCVNDYDVTIISTDFDHRKKVKLNVNKDNLVLLHVPTYKKNISIRRIISHISFAKKTKALIKNQSLDLVYCITPPNYLIKCLSKLRRQNIIKQLIYEIEDLWPETLPINRFIKLMIFPALFVWKKIRDFDIKYGDKIVFECDLFKDYLISKKKNLSQKSQTVYLCKDDTASFNKVKTDETIHFLYLGSINNLIDIDLIVNLLSIVKTHVSCDLTIVGGGENADNLIENCKAKNICVYNYGIVYDEAKKESIVAKCNYALNIMNNRVFVGATMKSLEYFHYGLPIINTILGDTTRLVNEYQCGVNVDRKNLELTASQIINHYISGSISTLSANSRKVYELFFHPNCFEEKIRNIIND